MALRCTKIKLKPGAEVKVREWAVELNRRSAEVYDVLGQEGVTIEAAFLDKQADGMYLIYVMQSDDFNKSQAVTNASLSPIEQYHKDFKKSSWESAEHLESLIDFE